MKKFFLSLAAILHGLLFGHMARAGLIAFEGDPTEIMKAIKKLGDDIREEGTKALKEAERAGKLGDDTKKTVDELTIKHSALSAQLLEFEQKAEARFRAGEGEKDAVKSAGQRVIESKEFKDFLAAGDIRQGVRVPVDVKAVTTATVGGAIAPDFRPEIIGLGRQAMTIRDLMSPGSTSSNAVTYVKETGFTNSAAPVAEGALKPTSDLTLAQVTVPVLTLAHLAKASVQILEDLPQLMSWIDGRLRYGLRFVEELQLLKGSGVGLNLNGIFTQATTYSAPIVIPGTPTPRIDKLRLMMLQAFLAQFPATGIVLHPSDWTAIELTKDSQGRYIIGNPQSTVQPTMWGLPVVQTQAMSVDTALVGAFKPLSQIFDKPGGTQVVIATENNDDFEKNMITVRAEERLTSAVYRPEGFIKVASLIA